MASNAQHLILSLTIEPDTETLLEHQAERARRIHTLLRGRLGHPPTEERLANAIAAEILAHDIQSGRIIPKTPEATATKTT